MIALCHISSAPDRSVVVLARANLSFICNLMTGTVSALQWGLFASYQILACVLSGYWSQRVFGTCPDCSPVLACDEGAGVDLTSLSELLVARNVAASSWWGLTTTLVFAVAGVGLGWLIGVKCSCGCDHRYRRSSYTSSIAEPLAIPRRPISKSSISEGSSPQRSPTSSRSPSVPEETVAVWKPCCR